jgi:heme exporter protein B
MNAPILKVIWTIVRKDLRTELRSRELVSAMLVFTLLSVLIFSFALELDRLIREEIVGGVLWVTMVFTSILGLNRSLASELEQGALDAMMLAPIDRTAIYFGKMVGNFLFTLVVGLLLLPIMSVLYNLNLIDYRMILTVFLGVLGLSGVGTLLATMTVQTRSRETLLPIAMLPVTLPILLIGVRANKGVITGEFDFGWILSLLVIDTLYIIIGALLFEYVIED